MRLLLILHENPEGWHDDHRHALERLTEAGLLEASLVYPFRARMASGMEAGDIAAEIVRAAEELEPTIVIWAHTGSLRIDAATLVRLRGLPSRPAFGYWEGDLFDRIYKPFPRPARRITAACDVVFVPGFCDWVGNLRRWGCADIRYTPSFTDERRFGGALELRGTATPDFDVVMIGNRRTSRVPFKVRPGARWRAEIVDMLERRLGGRFAVFGTGWRGPCAQGSIAQTEQGRIYAASRVCVGVNNVSATYGFSNRLPVAMSCGALVAHNWEAGMDQVFGESPPLRYFTCTEEAWTTVRELLETDEADLWPERVRARELALDRFTVTHVYEYMLTVLRYLWESRRSSSPPPVVENPWLGSERL